MRCRQVGRAPSCFYSSSLLFVSIVMSPSHTSLRHHLPYYLQFLLLHPPSSPFSYHSASHPRGDGEQWIYSNGGERCFKKKRWHGLYYLQLGCTSQLCPQCLSFPVTLIWLLRYESQHRIRANNLGNKVSFRQTKRRGSLKPSCCLIYMTTALLKIGQFLLCVEKKSSAFRCQRSTSACTCVCIKDLKRCGHQLR